MTRINTNVPSLVAQNRLQSSNADLQTSLTRLSTGLRINSGSDDPAGLIASEALRSEITSLGRAISNTRRASQIISTADSALGQVSSLLNDIRGLVVEAANNGALSFDEIAANQLQIDSSLEAINRISQTTTFQGRKLLDGGLDFLTKAGANFNSVSDLRIDQANLGPAGRLDVSVRITSAATQARLTIPNIPVGVTPVKAASEINFNRASAPAATATPGSVNFTQTNPAIEATTGAVTASQVTNAVEATRSYSIANTTNPATFDIVAKSGGAYAGATGNNATFEVVQNGAQVDDVEVNKSGDNYTISIRTGATVSLADVKAAFDLDTDVNSDFDFTITAGGAEAVDGATNTAAQTSLQNGANVINTALGDFTVASRATGAFSGADLNTFALNVTTTAAAGGSASTINVNTGSSTIDIVLEEGQTLSQIATFLASNADVSFTSAGTTAVAAGADTLTATGTLGSGAESTTSTAAIAVTSDNPGAVGNKGITFVKVGGTTTPTASIVGNNIQVRINNTGTTALADIASAINNISGFSAALTNTDTPVVGAFDNTAAAPSTTALIGGLDAITAATGKITLTASADGSTANGKTITFNKVDGQTSPSVTVTDGNIIVNVEDTDAVTLSSIVSAINQEGTYTAAADSTGGIVSFDGDTDTFAPPVAFADGVEPGGLTQGVVFELLGKTGSEVFNISKNTGIDDLITQINLVSDATGVTASKNGQDLELSSSDYGSAAFVDLRVISEAAGGTINAGIGAGARSSGKDIEAKVNGVDANGRGNKLTVNTSTLDLSITVEAGTIGDIGFSIAGGGALFQLGADVVSNQQARVGISSVSTSRLGGASGLLFQLGSGESAAVDRDPNSAARIVTEAINQITSLRGRLGAFQATSLESNLVSLNDTLANLQEAESSIRDADFAQESANLTRAQILVQSGTNVLSLANQNPQNVLSLLR